MELALQAIAGAVADRYEIERELGSGGMAVVYLARDLRHDRHVAIKVLKPDISASVSAERFLREVRVAARLSHAHIVGLIDSGRVTVDTVRGDLLYYVMPYIKGETLRDRLRREGQLPIADALQIAAEVCDALAFAHDQGVIHRDIKPENILIAGSSPTNAPTWHAMVADFGVARLISDRGETLTATGMSVGTPAYMSPEQAGGDRAIDARTDVYSLGCVLYEMLVGEPPFTGPNASTIVARHLSAPVPSIRTVRRGVPEDLEALVQATLEKVPADRVADAATLKARLDRIVTHIAGDRPHPTARADRRSQRSRIVAGAALAVVAATLGAYAMRSGARDAVSPLPAAPAPTLDRMRIAVMPLRLVGDSTASYVADASTDELISALSRVGGLRVLARGSVQSDSAARPALEIARALSAGSVIEGTMTERGDSIKYDVTLADVNSGEHAWSHTYRRRKDDLGDVQDSVARAIAVALSPRQSAEPDVRVAVARVSGPAYDAYLHGVYFARRTVQGRSAAEDSAIRYFERALTIDPGFALAHAAIAEMYTQRFFSFDPNPKWEQRAFNAVEKALTLDPSLAEAYQAKGNLTWTRANGFPHVAAAKLHRKAIALNPSLVSPHQSLGSLYMHVGLLDRALGEYNAALDLDPTTTFVPPRIARVHWYQGNYAVALRELESIGGALRTFTAERALILNYRGRSAEGLALLDSLETSSLQSYDSDAARAVLYASQGERALALAAISRALAGSERASHFHHAEYSIAEAYALLGDKDKALEFLAKTAADGMPCYPLFERDPHLRSLAADPRFVRFMTELRQRWERFKETVE